MRLGTLKPKCNKFNVRLTEFCWQSVPKPWTYDREAHVTVNLVVNTQTLVGPTCVHLSQQEKD